MENNCIFCKIANGEIPAATVYEDEDFRAILDLGPASKGHTLILPKKHAANLFELPEETAKKVLPLAKKLGARLEEGLHAEGLNVVQNNGEAARTDGDAFPCTSHSALQKRHCGCKMGAGYTDRG